MLSLVMSSILALPSARQLDWHATELYTLIHFGPNTFTGKEWGHGDEKPGIFNPTQYNPRQWAKAIKAGGFKGMVMVAKHHDGFCLWPSRYSSHTVRESPWRGGQGDAIREAAEACRAEGLKFGVYLSPWDRNHPSYGKGEAYNEVYRRQQEELLTQYGDLFMFWFDGANGEGPNGKKQVYDWPSFWETVRRHQPGASMFSDVGPDVRWVGNEAGWAGETNWNSYRLGGLLPGNDQATRLNPYGMEGGETWLPAECDVPLRPGWFWRESEDSKVKSLAWMVDTYFKSVGRGASLNLGLAPDSRGLLHENDVRRLAEFGAWLRKAFRTDLTRQGKASVSSGSRGEAWRPEPGDPSPSWTVEWTKPVKLNVVQIQEFIERGQTIKSFEVWTRGPGRDWSKAGEGTTIGWKRLLVMPEQEVTGLQVRITGALRVPSLRGVSAYRTEIPSS